MPSWGKTDFRQLKQLQQRMERLQTEQFDDFCRAAAKELAARLLGKVIPRTPVGRKPRLAARDGDDKKALGGVGAKGSVKVKSRRKETARLLTREGAILDRYWSGYVGGDLRRGWTARTEAEAKSGTTQDPVAYDQSLPIGKSGSEYTIEIINPLQYASYVEYGHIQRRGRYVPQIGKRLKTAWVKGRFMLTISEQELRAQAPAILEKKLKDFLKGAFNGQ